MLVLSGLEGDAVYRAGRGAQVAGHTALFSVRIAGQDNAAAPSRGQIRPLFGVKDGFPFSERVKQNGPNSLKQTKHNGLTIL